MAHTGTRSKKRQKGQETPRSRCTILLDADVDRKLSVAAHLAGQDRSEFLNGLLSDALAYIVISIRGTRGVSAESAGDVNTVASIEAA
jgi:hypothetical protein